MNDTKKGCVSMTLGDSFELENLQSMKPIFAKWIYTLEALFLHAESGVSCCVAQK